MVMSKTMRRYEKPTVESDDESDIDASGADDHPPSLFPTSPSYGQLHPSAGRTSSQRPDNASDSGYSSTAPPPAPKDQPVPAAPDPPAVLPPRQAPTAAATNPPASKPRPILIQRSESTRDKARPNPAVSPALGPCTDPACGDPNCASLRDRRFTLPSHPAAQKAPSQSRTQRVSQQSRQPSPAKRVPQQPQPTPMLYQEPPSPSHPYQAMNPPSTQYAVPGVSHQLRPRAASYARSARPLSVHGYPGTSWEAASMSTSPSAAGYYYPPAQQMPAYSSTSAAYQTSARGSTYGGSTYGAAPLSARTYDYTIAGPEQPRTIPPTRALTRTTSVSARRGDDRSMSVGYHPAHYYSEAYDYDYDSDEEVGLSDDDRPRAARHNRRRSEARAITEVASTHRPALGKSYTTPAIHQARESRSRSDSLRHAPHPNLTLDYPPSPPDTDRTPRPSRTAHSHSRTRRRLSVSTTDSSANTKATTLSSASETLGPTASSRTYESRTGRQAQYMTKERQELRNRRHSYTPEEAMHGLSLEDKLENAAAYQKDVSGGEPIELAAGSIPPPAAQNPNRRSGSHVSGTRSSASGSRNTEGVTIHHNGALLRLTGDATVQVSTNEDGGQPTFTITSGSSSHRDADYHVSRYHPNSQSSGSRSRVSRHYHDSRRHRAPIQEEQIEYEDVYDHGM